MLASNILMNQCTDYKHILQLMRIKDLKVWRHSSIPDSAIRFKTLSYMQVLIVVHSYFSLEKHVHLTKFLIETYGRRNIVHEIIIRFFKIQVYFSNMLHLFQKLLAKIFYFQGKQLTSSRK